MSPERWQQIEEIFQDALDLPLSKRGKFVAEKCGEDSELKSEVEKLLLQFEDASSFIETPALSDENANVLSKLMEFDDDDPMIGIILGTYRIEREIGRGGMGAVYEAIRADGEFRRKAAIKIVKRGMDTDFILRRFRNERQILATLEHPYITRLLDGGTTDDGRPYFVMDYIEGLPLYRYSDKKRLAIDERLKLFTKICEAVEYAHQNLVIHRDLKPSNILVSADGTPRLLDFGIAKLLNPEMASDTLQPTATSMRMMTIDYASPEQVNGEKVTFATDIYSLGVILFELLTGHRPYRFQNRTPHEIARVICEESPMLPSDAITRSEETLPIIHVDQEALTIRHLADLRKNSPDKLREILRGNLDNITLKALCKLPDERYNSVKRFREDIEKHLEGKPVSTPFYFPIDKVQTTQNNANTKLIAVLPLKLVNFSATENTDENYLSIGLADAIISRLTSVRDFTVRPTSSISGYEKREIDPLQAGRELGVDFVLDGRIKKYGQKLRVSLQMLDVRQGATTWAGQFDEKFSDVLALEDAISEQVAEALISQNTGENRLQLGKRGTDNAQAYDAYLRGRYFWNQFTPETFPKALASFEHAIELDPNYALAYAGIADYYNWATIFGFYAPLEGYQKTRDAALRALEINPQLSEAISVLAFITAFTDYNWAEAEKLFKQSLELNPNYGLTHEWYSALLAGTGRDEEAYTEILRSHELDPLSLRAVTLTAWTLYQLKRYPEALAKVEELFEMNPNYYQAFFQRGNILREMGRTEEAVVAGRKGMQLAPGLGYLHSTLCFALASLNRYEEAWEVLREYEQNSPATEINSYHLGMCYAAVGERETAFKWFNKAIDDRHPWCVWLATDAKLDELRNDERFNELLRKSNRSHLVKEISNDASQTLAVLPFKINSLASDSDTEEKFLGLGLTDALITRLSKAKQLVVRPTGSVVRFSESIDAFRAGKELEVKYVLDGNLRIAEKRVRVSVQLLNIEQNSTEWAENFDEKFTDILELEDSISEQVVKSLLPQLTTSEQQKLSRRETDDPQAYEAYLKGRFYWNQFTPDALSKAFSEFEKAVKLDPNYALAYVGLADFYIWANIYGLIPSKQATLEAEKHARKAVELDENLGEAYATLGLIAQNRKQWAEAERLKLKAIELAPNYPLAHEWYAAQLRATGRNEEAEREIAAEEKLDPLSRRTKTQAAWLFYQGHQFEESLKRGKEIIELDKNYPMGNMQIGISLWGMKRHEEALPYFEKFNEMIPDSALVKYSLCFALVRANKAVEARKVLDEIKTLDQNGYVKPYFLAMAHTALGEFDKAFELFEKSLAEDDPWMMWLATDPMLEELHGDARYIDILQRMNNPLAKKYKSVKPKVSSEQKSIAVLLFKKIGKSATGEIDDDFLGYGMADSIITRLTKVNDLSVRPTSSVSNFAETVNPSEAGKQLNVEFVLDGTIRYVKNAVRVSVQLLRVKDSSTIWSQQFDEPAKDILQLEDVISQKVAVALLPQLDTKERLELEKKYNVVPEAYDAYLRGRYFWNKLTPESLFKSLEMFEKAISLDPNFAIAYVGLADFHVWLCAIGHSRTDETLKKAKAAAENALEIDPTLIEANYALSCYESIHEHNPQKAENLLKQILEVNPNYWVAYEALAFLYSSRLDFKKGIEAARKAEKLNPLSTRSILSTARCLSVAGRFAESEDKAQETLSLDPTFLQGMLNLADAKLHLGQPNEAIPLLETCLKVSPNWTRALSIMAFALVATNQQKKAQAILKRLEKDSETKYVSPYFVASVCVALNQPDKAFEWLEKAYEERNVWLIWMESEAKFESIRDDVRFKDLLRRINPFDKKETFKPVISEKKTEQDKYSIAVLPLQFIGEIETGDAYLSVGLADAMVTRLSQVRRLVVRPTNSVLRFAETQDSFAAGGELGVDYVLSGMIRPAGKRIRISAQLLDVKENTTLWSEKFDEEFTEVLDLEDKVAEKVAKLLIPQLTAEEEQKLAKRNVKNVEAYEAYLRGKYHFFTFTPDDFAKAISYFEKAIELDPNYALAYSALSDVYFTLAGFASNSPAESFLMIEKMANKAIELDDQLGEAYSNLGMVKSYYFDLENGEKLFQRGLELNPNQLNGYVWHSVFLSSQGKSQEAIAQARKAYELDPTSGFHQYHYIWVLYHHRRFDEAVNLIRKADESLPNFAHGQAVAGWIFRHLNDEQEALTHSEKAHQLSPETDWITANLAATYGKFGEKEKAVSLLRQIESQKNRYVSPYCVAQAYLNLGDKEKALGVLEKSVADKDVWYLWITSDPELDLLRSEPRFIKLIEKIKPFSKTEATIHQSQVPTKIFTAEELKGTKQEEKKEETKTETANPSLFYRHRFKFVALAVFSLLTAIAYATGILTVSFEDRGRLGLETKNPARRSVAVLPFKNETSSPENDFLCEGLSENLINRLQSAPKIQVLPRSTSFKYKSGGISPQQAGIEMQVDSVLMGKLVKNGKEIEIEVELIDVKTGSRMWGFGFRGGDSDLVFLQNKMADDVGRKFSITDAKQAASKSYTENSEAFELYLKGEFHRQKATPEDTKKALEFYKKALELDQNYALAHQGLALTYRLAPAYGTLSPNEAYPLGKESAMKALAIDPTLGSAYIPLASIKYVYDWDFAGAETEYKQAIQLVPNNPEAHYSYGNFLVAMGRSDEAINELKIAQQFEPNSSNIASNIAWALYIAGRFDEAENQIKQVLAREPNFARAYISLGEIYVEQGKFDEAIAAFQKAKQTAGDPLTDMAIGHVHAVSGRKSEALKIAAELEARVMKKEVSPFLPAVVYAGLNDKDKAFYWLERAYQERSNWLTLIKVGRRLRPLHGDPRFDDLLNRIGFKK